MKIDVNYQFKTLDGKGIKGPSEDKKKQGLPFTLRKVCVAVLLNPTEDNLKADDKIERYYLAQKIHKSDGLVDLRSEEITLLKELIAVPYPPLTVAQAYEILDPHKK